MWGRRPFTVALSVSMVAAVVGAALVNITVASATTTVQDQVNPGPIAAFGNTTNTRIRAQVFRAGISGQLTRLTLNGCDLNDDLTGVTIRIYDAAGTPQNATPPAPLPPTPLGEVTISGADLSIIPSFADCTNSFDVLLDSPANLVAENLYSFVVSATAVTGGLRLYSSTETTYTRGNRSVSENSGTTWTAEPTRNLIFATYMTVSSPSADAPASTFDLALNLQDGAVCRSAAPSGVSGSWVPLPAAGDCSPPTTRPNDRLLGWATSPDFPIDIAARQVRNGWGAYEIFSAVGQLTDVFIPAGGSALLSASGNLHPIWGQ